MEPGVVGLSLTGRPGFDDAQSGFTGGIGGHRGVSSAEYSYG